MMVVRLLCCDGDDDDDSGGDGNVDVDDGIRDDEKEKDNGKG